MSKQAPAIDAQQAKAVQPKLEKVTLLKAHTHNGKDFVKDDEIEVNEADKVWLIANKVIAGAAPDAN